MDLQTLVDSVHFEMSLRIVAAALAGGVLGWNRERRDKPAGLRTHMMVALGAATFMVTTILYGIDADAEANDVLQIDPTRVIAGVIGGVGFLGAGSIIESRGEVHGVTTAAGIWVAAALGIACGLGMYVVTASSVLLAWLTLGGIGFVERHWINSKAE